MKIAILTVLAVLFLICVGPIKGEAEAQNCPYDWHPPPCGVPPPPVKDRKKEVIKQAERYHFETAAVMGLIVASTCVGKAGGPPWLDMARGSICKMATFTGALAGLFHELDARLIEEINGARDGTQFVANVDDRLASFSVDMSTDGDPYYDYLVEHGNAIETIARWIGESIETTSQCNEWAMYDLRGITCGDNQRAWTNELFHWMGQHYSAVSALTDALNSELYGYRGQDSEIDSIADTFNYDRIVTGWEGWEYQQ